MSKAKKIKNFVSDVDQFLKELRDKNIIKSESVLNEEAKYRKVFELRDNAYPHKPRGEIWKDF